MELKDDWNEKKKPPTETRNRNDGKSRQKYTKREREKKIIIIRKWNYYFSCRNNSNQNTDITLSSNNYNPNEPIKRSANYDDGVCFVRVLFCVVLCQLVLLVLQKKNYVRFFFILFFYRRSHLRFIHPIFIGQIMQETFVLTMRHRTILAAFYSKNIPTSWWRRIMIFWRLLFFFL